MFEAWGRALYTRRRLTLGIALVLVAFAAVWGTGVFGKLSSGNSFTPPASQSQREADQASQVFGRNDADVVVLYRSATRTVGDPAYRQAVTGTLGAASPFLAPPIRHLVTPAARGQHSVRMNWARRRDEPGIDPRPAGLIVNYGHWAQASPQALR